MKKQELIHLHGLLGEVVEWCDTAEDISIEAKRYGELSTRPTSIHRSKTDHKHAVFALTEAITAELEAEGTDTIPAGAD